MKYKLTEKTKVIGGARVYRIQSLMDFTTIIGREVKIGDEGGYVQSMGNLSQDGLCWLFDDAVGMGNSRRIDNSVGSGNSIQWDNSQQSGNSQQYGYSHLYGDSCEV